MTDELLLVEAILFSAGRPLTIEEVAQTAGIDGRTARALLSKLKENYSRRSTAIEIVRVGKKYSMQLKKELTERVRGIAPPELPRELLQTAALIAYHQPILQSELARRRGERVYEEIAELRRMGLINVKRKGHTLELTTSMRFAEFFGIEAKKPEEIRAYFEKTAGNR
ncbi:MAG: SMC-Scp complex subunit ScpB [Methanomassiliicoccales archaeon]